MRQELLSRRALLRRSAQAGLAALLAPGCKAEPPALSCADTTALPSADAQMRTTLSYLDVSVEPAKSCAACQQFVPGPASACGTCKVLKGAINPAGYCKSFLARPPGPPVSARITPPG